MDISKLPKLSQTPKPADNSTPDTPAEKAPPATLPPATVAPPQPSTADVFLSVAIGVIILLMAPRFLQFLSSMMFHTAFTWTFTDGNGQPLDYSKTVFFWGDLALTLFALVLVVDGLLLLSRSRLAIVMAFSLTCLSTLLNIGFVVAMFGSYGFQVFSGLAGAIGIYLMITQWNLLFGNAPRQNA